MADGRADMMFNFGCAYERTRLHGAQATDVLQASHVDAQRTYPVSIAHHGAVHLISVRFQPGGLSAFCPFPLHEISGGLLDLPLLFGASVYELEGRLFEARDIGDVQALLDRFFLQRLAVPLSHTIAHGIAQQISVADPSTHMRNLSRDVGYSIRTVDRYFQHVFGFPPKYYARMLRFRRTLAALVGNPALDWAAALGHGYYDQPQFIKEFRAFTGMTPEQYRATVLARHVPPAPNLVQLLQEH